MTLSNKMYDALKFVALVVLPALAVLYVGLGSLWPELPDPQKVGATIILFDTFLGILLQINTQQYNAADGPVDGYLASNGVDPDTGIPNLKLTITTMPDELLDGKTATLKIGQPPTE